MEELFTEMGEITREIGEFSASTSRAMLDDVRARLEKEYIRIYNNCNE